MYFMDLHKVFGMMEKVQTLSRETVILCSPSEVSIVKPFKLYKIVNTLHSLK